MLPLLSSNFNSLLTWQKVLQTGCTCCRAGVKRSGCDFRWQAHMEKPCHLFPHVHHLHSLAVHLVGYTVYGHPDQCPQGLANVSVSCMPAVHSSLNRIRRPLAMKRSCTDGCGCKRRSFHSDRCWKGPLRGWHSRPGSPYKCTPQCQLHHQNSKQMRLPQTMKMETHLFVSKQAIMLKAIKKYSTGL